MVTHARSGALRVPAALFVVALGVTLACREAPDDEEPIAMCHDITDEASCEDGSGCAWDPQDLECVVDCARIDTMTVCDEQDSCFWDGGTCHYGIA